MIKTIFITGYKPHELGIFNDNHPGIPIIKRAIENQLRALLDDGLEWVVISGQQGVETWAAQVVLELKVEFPELKYSIITPFLEQEKNWNEHKQATYLHILQQADFVTSVTKRSYEAPWQFIEKDKFIIDNTDAALLVYDEENEGSPKYVQKLILAFQKTHDYYELLTINAYDLQTVAEDIQTEHYWE